MEVLAGIGLLAILIVFHEFGHYLVARLLGVRVLVFSLGFGPKLFSIKKGHTEYCLSLIPLGGYVRMFGESDQEELLDEEKGYSFWYQPVWKKSLIAVAGPVFNFILPVVIFFGLAVGNEQVYAPVIGTLLEDGVAKEAGLKPKDQVLKVNDQEVFSFSDLAKIIAENPKKELSLLIKRQGKESVITLSPSEASVPNPFGKEEKVGRIGIMPSLEMSRIMLLKDHPWKDAGFKNCDEIIAIDGVGINSAEALIEHLSQIKSAKEITVKREGQKEPLTIRPTGHILPLALVEPSIVYNQVDPANFIDDNGIVASSKDIIEDEQKKLNNHHGVAILRNVVEKVEAGSDGKGLLLRPLDRIVGIDGQRLTSSVIIEQILVSLKKVHVLAVIDEHGVGRIIVTAINEEWFQKNLDGGLLALGFSLYQNHQDGEFKSRLVGPVEAIKRAVTQTYNIGAMTVKYLVMLVTREVPASQLGGPLMLFDVAQKAAKKGLQYYLFIMCMLSVNLGLLNLLPIPALDGGHLLLFGIEGATGRPLTLKTRILVTQIGAALLLGLMMFALFNDLTRLFK